MALYWMLRAVDAALGAEEEEAGTGAAVGLAGLSSSPHPFQAELRVQFFEKAWGGHLS